MPDQFPKYDSFTTGPVRLAIPSNSWASCYPCDAVLAWANAMAFPFVCLSVCHTHALYQNG